MSSLNVDCLGFGNFSGQSPAIVAGFSRFRPNRQIFALVMSRFGIYLPYGSSGPRSKCWVPSFMSKASHPLSRKIVAMFGNARLFKIGSRIEAVSKLLRNVFPNFGLGSGFIFDSKLAAAPATLAGSIFLVLRKSLIAWPSKPRKASLRCWVVPRGHPKQIFAPVSAQ
jgi:hypothetical protein